MAAVVGKEIDGLKIEILKGDRGDHKGGYILIWKFDSAASRNQFFPREGGLSGPAFQQTWKRLKPLMLKFSTYVQERESYTDYVVVAD